MNHTRRAAAIVGAGAVLLMAGGVALAAQPKTHLAFHMVRSAASQTAGCLRNAVADVTIDSQGPVEQMTVEATGLPANTDFDLFVIQVPNAPFGLSWYQGDLQSDDTGHASGTFVGRFSVETFTVAPGVAPAPVVHETDASENPATAPVHQYHLGLWFNSPTDASAAGCAATVTPFNGEHNAGVQAMSTRNFADDKGPLRKIQS
jgi:hypothetical protein